MARAFARASGCTEHAAEILDDALLLISELVTNAVRYGQPPLLVALECEEGGLRVGVRDGAASVPAPRVAADDDESGRGLTLVGHLSNAWGVEPVVDQHGSGKVVWFELRAPDAATYDGAPSPPAAATSAGMATRTAPIPPQPRGPAASAHVDTPPRTTGEGTAVTGSVAAEPTSAASDLDLAYRRCTVAYRLARRAVFDVHPHCRLPEETDLSDVQRVVLRDLRAAEAELEEQRRLEREHSGVDVAGHLVA